MSRFPRPAKIHLTHYQLSWLLDTLTVQPGFDAQSEISRIKHAYNGSRCFICAKWANIEIRVQLVKDNLSICRRKYAVNWYGFADSGSLVGGYAIACALQIPNNKGHASVESDMMLAFENVLKHCTVAKIA